VSNGGGWQSAWPRSAPYQDWLPLLDQKGRLLRQFPTEDGYLMMTIARNLALGNGMSTAEGWIPTNGTQPGFNFIEALCFWFVRGNRHAGVLVIELLQFAIAVLAAWSLFALGKRVLRDRSWGTEAAALAAVAWYANASIVSHTMNCIETDAYVLLILTSARHAHLLWKNVWRREIPLRCGILMRSWACVLCALLMCPENGAARGEADGAISGHICWELIHCLSYARFDFVDGNFGLLACGQVTQDELAGEELVVANDESQAGA